MMPSKRFYKEPTHPNVTFSYHQPTRCRMPVLVIIVLLVIVLTSIIDTVLTNQQTHHHQQQPTIITMLTPVPPRPQQQLTTGVSSGGGGGGGMKRIQINNKRYHRSLSHRTLTHHTIQNKSKKNIFSFKRPAKPYIKQCYYKQGRSVMCVLDTNFLV